MANTVEIIINAKDNASAVFTNISNSASNLGDTFVNVGTQLTKVTAATNVALGLATKKAISYDESITNAAAILGSTVEEQEAMSDSLLDFSRTAGHGAQKVADAYFDIVSGVADADTHMAILEASTRTAEAGQADLISTNSALISSMNAYSFSADKAAFASDVMTRTVQGGVLTMDSLAAALPAVTTTAAQLNIGFDEVGASLAFMTTKGLNANVATNAMRAAMMSFMKPTTLMTAALEELGFESGEAAIETLGFQGALEAVNETTVAAENGMAEVIGSSRALQASMILTGEGAREFADDFIGSVEGATDAAGEIQFRAAQAHIDLFKSNLQALSITIGNVLMPHLVALVDKGTEIVGNVITWIDENEELTGKIVKLNAAVGIFAVGLITLGKAIIILSSPIGLIIGAVTALKVAWDKNFLGIADAFGPIIDQMVEGFTFIADTFGGFIDAIKEFGISDAIARAFGVGTGGGTSWVERILISFGVAEDSASQIVTAIVDALTNISSFVTTTFIPSIAAIGQIFLDMWDIIQPTLIAFGNWFLTDMLPVIASYITDVFIPTIVGIADRLVSLWGEIQPSLAALFDWFVVSALPIVTSIITDIFIPAIETMIDIVFGIWDIIAPTLISIFDWFVVSALPKITDFINTVVIPIISSLIDVVAGIWAIVEPPLKAFFDWFNEFGLPVITSLIEVFMDVFTLIGQSIALVLDLITGDFDGAKEMIGNIFDTLTNLVQSFLNYFVDIFQAGISIATIAISNIFTGIRDTAVTIFSGIRDAIQWVIDKIESLIGWISNIDLGVISDAADLAGDVVGAIGLSPGGSGVQALLGRRERSGFAAGTSFTGNGSPNAIAGFVHNREAVVPQGGSPVVMPSPRGLILDNMPESGGTTNQVTVQVTVPETQLLTPELAQENGAIFGQRINEELNFSG